MRHGVNKEWQKNARKGRQEGSGGETGRGMRKLNEQREWKGVVEECVRDR